MKENLHEEIEKYHSAINNLSGEESDINTIKGLIAKYYSMNRHMIETSLYDVFEYESKITSLTTEPLKDLAIENAKLKGEVNKLRVKLKLGKKYKRGVADEQMERK